MWGHRIEVAQLTLEHLVLVGLSMLIAVGIGFPLGVVMTRRPRLSRPILALANVVQTIPSLALFGFLIPLPFIGGIGRVVQSLRWFCIRYYRSSEIHSSEYPA